MNLDIDTGLKLINKCFEKEREAFQENMWLSLYPAMIHSYGMSEGSILELRTIDETFGSSKPKEQSQNNTQSIDEILLKTNKILAMYFEEMR